MTTDLLIRISGLIAWWLLLVTVVIGTIATGGLARHAVKPPLKFRIHFFLSRALLIAVVVHIGVILLTSWNNWSIKYATEVGWGSVARNFGVSAVYLLIVVEVSTLYKKHYRPQWKAIHHAVPFVILGLVTAHGLLAGPDRQFGIVLPGLAALTVLGAVFIARGYSTYAKKVIARKAASKKPASQKTASQKPASQKPTGRGEHEIPGIPNRLDDRSTNNPRFRNAAHSGPTGTCRCGRSW